MEVSVQKLNTNGNQSSSNSFECDSATLDAILGLNPSGEFQLRVDRAENAPRSHLGRRNAQVYAPLEVVPIASSTSFGISKPFGLELLSDTEFKRQRLARLLDRQQSWYDCQQQAARAAEQLLTLCEHHQQQWLLPNQPM